MSLASVAQHLEPKAASALINLLNVWQKKQARNLLKTTYYDGKNALIDLGISIPPQLKSIETQLGWPAKAVNSLADRCNFDGFVLPGYDDDPLGSTSLLEQNHFDVELPQSLISSLTHSVSFMTITNGDTTEGEPEVLLLARDANSAAGIWDARRRSLSSGLSIMDTDANGNPTRAALYLPGVVIAFRDLGNGAWSIDESPTETNRVLMEPLIFRPELRRPLGHSRISRTVMSLTDSAIRTVLRSEVSAEFFSAPQRYLLGADEGAFTDKDGKPLPKWNAVLGRFLAIGLNEEGDAPTMGQFPQQSMQPHSDQLRTWATLFAGETSLPLSDLGIVQDNPASAEAIFAAKESLVITARSANRAWGASLNRAIQTAVMLRDGLSEPTPEMLRLQAKWLNPATPSVVSASDAAVKQVSAMPWLADSPVLLEQLGYDQPTITRLLADKARAEAAQRQVEMAANLGVAAKAALTAPVESGGGAVIDPADAKAKFEALGIAIRAGVDPQDAARQVGLGAIQFTGAVPVSLRMPESQTGSLEER